MDAKDIIDEMCTIMPFYLSDNLRPYIYEAMEEYARLKCEKQKEICSNSVDSNHDSDSEIWSILKTIEDAPNAVDK